MSNDPVADAVGVVLIGSLAIGTAAVGVALLLMTLRMVGWL